MLLFYVEPDKKPFNLSHLINLNSIVEGNWGGEIELANETEHLVDPAIIIIGLYNYLFRIRWIFMNNFRMSKSTIMRKWDNRNWLSIISLKLQIRIWCQCQTRPQHPTLSLSPQCSVMRFRTGRWSIIWLMCYRI